MRAPAHRVLTPESDEHRFTDVCFALSAGTRVAILQTLRQSATPLHIREVARRVGLDASPVRTHLEVLVKAGLARELPEPGRERRFVADVSALRLVLAPPVKPADAPADMQAPKIVAKIDARLKELEAKAHRLELEMARLGEQRTKAWRR